MIPRPTRPGLKPIVRAARSVLFIGVIALGQLHSQTSISFPSDFPPKPIIFQQYNADTGTFLPMRFAGSQTVGPNGDISSTGPVYSSQTNFFPYVMRDTARNLFCLHPGTSNTVKDGAVVGVGVPVAGTYSVSGAFARENDFRNAGDGVRVVAFVNNQIGAPVFDSVISSNNPVNPNSPFSGTGVAPFSFSVSLAQGDTIQFAVFSGPSLVDGTFDFTALQFTIVGGGTTISLPADFPPKPIIFQEYDTGTGSFQPLKFTGNRTMGPNGDITSTGPVYWSQSPINSFPYLMLDTTRNIFFLEPGTFGTVQNGAVASAGISMAGRYNVSGAFARANDFRNAGDGVRVVAFVNNQISSPLFAAVISSDNAVNPNSPFVGTGVAGFNFNVSLSAGDTVQFAVFSGPNLLDGTFDFTALEFTIMGGGCDAAAPCITAPFNQASPQSQFAAISGTGTPRDTLNVLVGGFSVGQVQVDSEGNWEALPYVSLYGSSVTVQVQDQTSSNLSNTITVHPSLAAFLPGPSSPPNSLTALLPLRKADIFVTASDTSPQYFLYGPTYTHAALYLGGDSNGTPLIAEAVTAAEAGSSIGTCGQVRSIPLDQSLMWTQSKTVSAMRPKTALSGATRTAIAAWAQNITSQCLPYWTNADFGLIPAAYTLYHSYGTGYARFLNQLNTLKSSTTTFICSTLVVHAYYAGTNGTVDLSNPNLMTPQPWSLMSTFSQTFIQQLLDPVFVVPETIALSPWLSRVF